MISRTLMRFTIPAGAKFGQIAGNLALSVAHRAAGASLFASVRSWLSGTTNSFCHNSSKRTAPEKSKRAVFRDHPVREGGRQSQR